MKFEIIGYADLDFVYENAVHEFETAQVDAEERMMDVVQEAEVLLEAMLYFDSVTEANKAVKAATAPAKVVTTPAKVTAGAAAAGNKAVQGVKKAGAKAKQIVDRMIQFIKNMFARLVDTMQTWFQNSGKWLEARKGAFSKFKYDDLSIEMIPYWEGNKSNPIQRTSRSVLQYIADAFKANGVSKEEFDFDTFTERRLQYLLDTDGDLTEGMKNFYRVGNAKGKNRVNLSSSGLRSQVINEFIPTILNYNNYIQEAQNVQRTLDSRTSALAIEMDKRGIVAESALFGLPYNETLFATFEQFSDIVRENTPASSDSNRTKVTMGRDTRTQNQKDDDEEDKMYSTNLKTKNNGEMRILNNVLRAEKLMMSSYLTVMQERYSAYMNALKAIWSAANNVGGRNEGVNGEGKVVGKDEQKKK